MYASWSFVMFLITLSITLSYELGVNQFNTHLVIVGLLLIKIIIHFLIENFALYSYCKFVFTPWIVYGLFLLDLLLNPPAKSSLEHTGFRLFPAGESYWEYQIKHVKSLLYIDYVLEIVVASVFVLLFTVKVLKFIRNEFCNRKTFLNTF
jgi:hypothetical protein